MGVYQHHREGIGTHIVEVGCGQSPVYALTWLPR
jgi:hypothetical protein